MVDMPGVPDERAGVYNRAGLLGKGALVNICKQCQKQWSGGALAVGLVGGQLGAGNFYIWEEIIYYTPIWDVLAPEGEQKGALNHLTMRTRSPAFLIRKAVPVGFLKLIFAAGLVGLSFSGLKICTLLATVYLHII
jgi:hypothetical protein